MDHTVNTDAHQISTVPHSAVSITPKSCPSKSRKGIATICAVVLSLPSM